MRKLVLWTAIGAICLGASALLFPRWWRREVRPVAVRILPGIEARFTSSGDAAQHYAPTIRSFLARKSGDKNRASLTDNERKWFMLGTSCRKCNLYPEQFAHIMPNAPIPEMGAAKDIAVLIARRARALWGQGRDEEALGILMKVAVFGWHIEKEDECFVSNLAGINIQWIAWDYLARFYDSRGEAEKAEKYRRYIKTGRESLSPLYCVATPLKTWADFERIGKIALNHELAVWRREACFSLTDPFVIKNVQARSRALEVLRTVAVNDRDPLVRQWAAACIPYVEGRKKAP